MAEDETKQSGGVDLTQTIPLDHLPATLRRRRTWSNSARLFLPQGFLPGVSCPSLSDDRS